MNEGIGKLIHQISEKFGRPRNIPFLEDRLKQFDERLGQTEDEQVKIDARLKLLELQSNPRRRPVG